MGKRIQVNGFRAKPLNHISNITAKPFYGQPPSSTVINQVGPISSLKSEAGGNAEELGSSGNNANKANCNFTIFWRKINSIWQQIELYINI